ncbi:carbohydrate ABC transporter permease [Rhodoferax sp.]|uniref:carbohydrate ABC transporter permease n=1 Tax=Rhodoferax sp. TaxID=50421 RepID=UPI00374D9C83
MQTSSTPMPLRRRPKNWLHGLFVLPFLTVYVLLLVLPLVTGWWLSLQDVDMLANSSEFIGVKNYTDLFHDDIFLGAVRNTFYFVAMTTPVFVGLGLALALALNRPGRTGAALRAIFFGSSVLSVTIVTLVWRLVLMPDRGLLSNVMQSIGLTPIAPLVSEALALPSVALVTVWWIIGLPMMLFLAALQQIPQEMYEAAALDNAGRWRTFVSITLPSIKHTVALVAVIEVVQQFQLFGQSYLMTQGGPNNSSRPIVQFIYETGFTQWALGYSAAAAQVLFVLMLIGVSAQAWLSRHRDA